MLPAAHQTLYHPAPAAGLAFPVSCLKSARLEGIEKGPWINGIFEVTFKYRTKESETAIAQELANEYGSKWSPDFVIQYGVTRTLDGVVQHSEVSMDGLGTTIVSVKENPLYIGDPKIKRWYSGAISKGPEIPKVVVPWDRKGKNYAESDEPVGTDLAHGHL